MQLPLEYSAFVLGANPPKLELLFRRTTLCNSHVAELLLETDHQISHLTKTRDEIAFALGNLTRADEDRKFQDCLALASNSCESLSARLVHFLKPDESAAPGPAIRGVPGASDGGEVSWRELSNSVDLIEDLSEELADQWDVVTEQIEKRAGTLFEPLREQLRQLEAVMPSGLAPFYQLGNVLATLILSVETRYGTERYFRVQEAYPTYQAAFGRCVDVRPDIANLFLESLNDEQIHSVVANQLEQLSLLLRQPLPCQNGEAGTEPTGDEGKQPVPRHPYNGRRPGHISGWKDLLRENVKMCDRSLAIRGQQGLCLLRLLFSEHGVDYDGFGEVYEKWQRQLNSDSPKDMEAVKGNIRGVLLKLRRRLRKEFGIPGEYDPVPHRELAGKEGDWSLNWDLLDQHARREP